jgi:hypothetical protein
MAMPAISSFGAVIKIALANPECDDEESLKLRVSRRDFSVALTELMLSCSEAASLISVRIIGTSG